MQGTGEPPRKRKATSLQQSQPAPPHRQRSPSFPQQSQSGGGLSNPPRGLRRSHHRQQSDISSYTSYRRSQQEGVTPPTRGSSPGQSHYSTREGGPSTESGRPRSGGGHPVSSLLTSDDPGRPHESISEMPHGLVTKRDDSPPRREHST